MRGDRGRPVELHANPLEDPHLFPTGLPEWPGTVVGIDINVEQGVAFAELLDGIRKAYFLDVKHKKDYAKKMRFT